MNQWLVGVGGASHCVTEHTSLIKAIPINRVMQGHAQTITAWLRDVHQQIPPEDKPRLGPNQSPKPPTGGCAGGFGVRGLQKLFSFWDLIE